MPNATTSRDAAFVDDERDREDDDEQRRSL
jgi:hypothetical protein